MSTYVIVEFIFSIAVSKYWNDVFQNAIGCAIGSLAAIGISIWIYRETIRQSNKAISNEKIQDETNQLKAFKLMLEAAIKTADKSIGYIDEFILSLKKYPVEFPLLYQTSYGSLKRIIESISVEKTGKSYMKKFPVENSPKEFLLILEVIDYMYAEFGGLYDLVKRASTNHTERLMKVSDDFDVADKILIDHTSEMNFKLEEDKKVMEVKMTFINKRTNSYDMLELYNLYFIPMKELMMERLKRNPGNDFEKNYTYEITKGIYDYEAVGVGVDKFVLTMDKIRISASDNLNKLKMHAEKILQTDFA